jgi:hypothetical protein
MFKKGPAGGALIDVLGNSRDLHLRDGALLGYSLIPDALIKKTLLLFW